MQKSPKCSVVINTYNRCVPLEAVIEDLCDQSYANFELIVVTGPCSDGTNEMMAPLAPFLKWVTCSEANLCKSRNLGLAACSGDFALFIDDDAIPQDEHWIQRYVDAFQLEENQNTAILGSSVKNVGSEFYEFYRGFSSRYGFQTFENESESDEAIPDGWFERVIGCNNAMRLSYVKAVGGFDENFVYYADETDLVVRLLDAGYEVKNIAGNHVRHFKQQSDIRKSKHDIRWDVIARSDTYYSLKNAQDSLPFRVLKTFVFAWKKHYIGEVFSVWNEKEITFSQKIRWNLRLFRGIAGGYLMAMGKRKICKFEAGDTTQKTGFKALDGEAIRSVIRAKDFLAGSEIRLCRYFWGNREYPEHELFQVYYNNDGQGWSETKTEYGFYRRDKMVTFTLEIPVKGESIELRLDPCREVGLVKLEFVKLGVDGNPPKDVIRDEIRFEEMLEDEALNEDLLTLRSISEDPRLFLNPARDVERSISIHVSVRFNRA